ncbi:hypothetical protein AGMMS50256_01620 [Betaproteobacteria bacterium]|nr:hypothetical protein AGMMS50256_01620 [Betaproteobacteria bacterium]
MPLGIAENDPEAFLLRRCVEGHGQFAEIWIGYRRQQQAKHRHMSGLELPRRATGRIAPKASIIAAMRAIVSGRISSCRAFR